MKVSVNWLKQYLDFDLPPIDELVTKIGSQLGAVEEVINLGERYKNIYIVKVMVCEKLENSDHLHRCLIDDGGVVQGIERNEDGLVQVLTGAPNVHAGMLAVWLPPGTTVPESYEKEPFALQSRPMRGAMSHGMLASAKELAIGDSHEGLLEIDADEWSPHQADAKPGADFAKAYGLDDYIIDVENKMFTHRPDCFGILGVAREVAGIFGQQFKSPDWYATVKDVTAGADLALGITNDIPTQVPRFMAAAIKDVAVKSSPLWLQIELARVGAKPISNIVDVTNYVMLLTGQPLHAYDYDKVASGRLGARFAQKDEKLVLLNGKTIELTDADMVITDGTKPIGLAGVMGGAETEVSDDTKNIILECATFDMYTIRRTSMRHGLFTDAVTRFNKGQSPLQNPYILSLAIQSVHDVAGGAVASAVIDDDHTEGRQSVHPPVTLQTEFINARLGLDLSAADMATLLKNVEFKVTTDNEQLTVSAPFWRTDIELPEDVVEEVGRLYGFDKLPLELPKRGITPATEEPLLKQKSQIRNALVTAGANELLTYSFVHGNLLDKVMQPRDKAFKIANALSPDLQYYRYSALASLLDKVHANVKAGYDEFALFELGKGHNVDYRDQDGLPLELENLDLVYASKTEQKGAAYYHARRYLDVLAAHFSLTLTYRPQTEDPHTPMSDPFDFTRSARVFVGDAPLGLIGEFKPSVIRNLKLPKYVAGFTISQTQLLAAAQARPSTYQPLPRFPKTRQDICLRVPSSVAFTDLDSLVRQTLQASKPENTVLEVSPLDIYQRPDDPEHKQITFHIGLASFERTLTDQEVTKLLTQVADAAHQALEAETV